MKKHPFLTVEYQSTVKLLDFEERQLKKWLSYASLVMEELFNQKIIPSLHIKSIQVSLLICGEEKIRKLNREFRDKDKVTDVLSFPNYENLRKIKTTDTHLFLGDLAICHQKVKSQAKKFDISYFDEFIHLYFHGLIHLLGYDHELSNQEERMMQKWEKLALDRLSQIKKGAR